MARSWTRALITGASSGIGEAFARELGARGAHVVVVARRRELLKSLAQELRSSAGVEAEVLVADVTDPHDLAKVEARLDSSDDPIDLLVNNAGGSKGSGRGAFAEHPVEMLENQALLNAVSVMRLTHVAVRAMRPRGEGNVVQVSAGTAFYPVPYGSVYAASKAFVNSFSQAVHYEMQGSGVYVTVVCPGFTRTEGPRRVGFTEANVPVWWWSDPEEVVEVALKNAAKGKAVCSPKTVNRFNATLGRHFPQSMMRMSARMTRM